MLRLTPLFTFAAPFVLLACGSVGTTKLPHGGYRITCEKGMGDCVSRADKVCGKKGYTILGGQNATKVLGGSSSNYQASVFVGDLEVVCGPADVKAPDCKEKTDAERQVHSLGGASEPIPASGRVCVPGSTQACVGAGACAGGQVCSSDGSGYGACDCGTSSAPASTPALPPAAQPTPSAPPQVGPPAAEPL